jgi:hypothetical protein
MELGKGLEAPERLKKDRRILTPADLFPAAGSTTTMIVLSVFSSTKWMKDSLTDKYLAILFDVPVDMQSLAWTNLAHLFITPVPFKSLWAATSSYYRAVLEEDHVPIKEEVEPALSALDKKLIGGGTANSVDWSQVTDSCFQA